MPSTTSTSLSPREDSAPRTLEGAVLSIADKADSALPECLRLGLVPSGSKDPFALRRQANGIVKIIVEHKLPLNLDSNPGGAPGRRTKGSEAEKKFTLSGEAYVQASARLFPRAPGILFA